MKKTDYPINFTEFKVKRRWWILALFILIHIFAVISIRQTYFIFAVVFILDMIVILPDASHFRYIINDKFIIVKRILYPDIEIPVSTITAVNAYTLFAMRGFGLKIIEHTYGGYRIIYHINRMKYVVIVAPKESEEFIGKLSSNLTDKSVILINNTESAFKKKKDQYNLK